MRYLSLAVCCAAQLLFVSGSAEAGILDSYTCAQFVGDLDKPPAAGSRSLASFMAIAWATGYAAAHDKNSARADDDALKLMTGVVVQACRQAPDKRVIEVVISTVDRFVSAPQSGSASPESTSKNEPTDQGKTPSIPKPASSRKGVFAIYNNFDLPQGDSKRLERVDQTKCASVCTQKLECRAYSYDKWNRWCFLKSKVTSLTFDPSSVSAVRGNSEQPSASGTLVRIEQRTSQAFEGPYTAGPKPSSEECASECDSRAECLGYSYLRDRKSCRLFTDITGVVSNADAVSGFKTQSAP